MRGCKPCVKRPSWVTEAMPSLLMYGGKQKALQVLSGHQFFPSPELQVLTDIEAVLDLILKMMTILDILGEIFTFFHRSLLERVGFVLQH